MAGGGETTIRKQADLRGGRAPGGIGVQPTHGTSLGALLGQLGRRLC